MKVKDLKDLLIRSLVTLDFLKINGELFKIVTVYSESLTVKRNGHRYQLLKENIKSIKQIASRLTKPNKIFEVELN